MFSILDIIIPNNLLSFITYIFSLMLNYKVATATFQANIPHETAKITTYNIDYNYIDMTH
jgi:hypothetical protein